MRCSILRRVLALAMGVVLAACSNSSHVIPTRPPADLPLAELVRRAEAAPVTRFPARGQRLPADYGVPLTASVLAEISARVGRTLKTSTVSNSNGPETARLLTLKRSVRTSTLKSAASKRISDVGYNCTVTVYGWLWPDGSWTYDHSDYFCMEYYLPDFEAGAAGGPICDTGAIYVAVGDDARALVQAALSRLGAGGGDPNDPQRQADIAASDKIQVAESHFFDHAPQILQNPTLDATQTGLMRGIARLMVASGTREAGFIGDNGVSQMFITPTDIWARSIPGMFSSNLPAYFVTFRSLSTGKLTTLFATSSKNLTRVVQSFLNKQVGYDANDADGAGDDSIISAAPDDNAFTDNPPICSG